MTCYVVDVGGGGIFAVDSTTDSFSFLSFLMVIEDEGSLLDVLARALGACLCLAIVPSIASVDLG